jgi:hypothetical protein
MKNWLNFNKSKKKLDRAFGFAIFKIVNPTAFLRFGGRRQFFISEQNEETRSSRSEVLIYEEILCLY